MFAIAGQTALAALACFGLWRLARRSDNRIIIAGFLLRAFAAQALFWVSWLRLPIGRSMQLGNGLWFFGLDGAVYYGQANELLSTGHTASESVFFLRLIVLMIVAFGNVVFAPVLLNLAAYLGTAQIIETLGERSRYTTFALLAIAFGPSHVLWSLQPLKDPLFFFLIAALVKLLVDWQSQPRAIDAIAMVAVVFAIAGVRPYMALFICASSIPYFLMQRRSVLLFFALIAATWIGGGSDLQRVVRKVATRPAGPRTRFNALGGATAIRPGPMLVGHPLATGVTATFVPRAVAQAAGLVHIGGGRGFWLVAEIDTLLLDAVIVVAIVLCVRARRITAAFVFLALLFVMTGGPMVYTVTNFGTLFRLRQMLYVMAILLPLTLPRR